LTKILQLFYYIPMFNRFFCFLLLAIVGLNLVSFNINIKSKAVDVLKPYISEVWYGDSGYTDKCRPSKPYVTKTAKGLCSLDAWVEITNPTSNVLSGYRLDTSSNRSFKTDGGCEDLDLTDKGDAGTNNLLCKSREIRGENNIPLSIAPNSTILLREKYGTLFQSMLVRGGLGSVEIDLVHTGTPLGYFSVDLISNTGSIVDSFSSAFTGNSSIQVCIGENGSKKQTSSTKPFQAGEKTFYGTPGLPNICPEIVMQTPIPPPPAETPPPAPKPAPLEFVDNQVVQNPISQVAKNNIVDKKDSTVDQTALPLPIPKIEIKADIKPETKKITPVTFKVEQETIPVQTKIEKPLALVTPAAVEVKKEIIQEIKQKPIVIEIQRVQALKALTQPLPQERSKPSNSVQNFATTVNPSVVSQTKTVNVIDEKQTKIFGVDVTKAATVDMHTIKVNFIYFDLAIIIFLLTKTTLQNKQYALNLFDLARQKVFQSK
jgi:hypothetical protein